jgi:hypothetical protein
MVNTCTALCNINNLRVLHTQFMCSCESQSNSDYFLKQHSSDSLQNVDGLYSVWSKKKVCVCSLNEPPACHSISAFDRPTRDAEFLRKFRFAIHASHSSL